MSRLVTILILLVALAIARVVLVGLALIALLTLTYAFLARPRETAVFVSVLTVSGLLTARPIAGIIALTAISLAVVVAAGCCGKARKAVPEIGRGGTGVN